MRHLADEERRELGKKIKSARKQKGLSQEQLADLLGYKVGTISKYEQGYRIPNIGMLRKIAGVLDCNLVEIAGSDVEVIQESIRFEAVVKSYINWLRAAHLIVAVSNYEDNGEMGKMAIIIYIDGVPFDIADNINEIMQMGKEHFKLLAKQFGKGIYQK